MKFKKIIIVSMIVCFLFIFIERSFENERTTGQNVTSTNVYETYTKNITVGCGKIGVTQVTMTIAHNIRNGKSWLYSIAKKDYIPTPFTSMCQIKTVKTDKKIGETFSGMTSIKMTVVYSISETDYEIVQYVYL